MGQRHPGVTEDATVLAADFAGLGKHRRVRTAASCVVADHGDETATKITQPVAVVFSDVAVPSAFLLAGAPKLGTDTGEGHPADLAFRRAGFTGYQLLEVSESEAAV